MKKLLLFGLAASLISSLSFATIRRVGYFGPAVSGVDYSTFQLAHDASLPGDTIMMHPGSNFGTATMTKKLVVIGPGYFLGENAGLQANPLGMDSTQTGSLTISNETANGSSFIGCTFPPVGVILDGDNIADISFSKCWFLGNESSGTRGAYIYKTANNIIFIQCVFKGSGIIASGIAIASNFSFINCLFYSPGGFPYGVQFSTELPHSGLFQNCIFNGANFYYFQLNGTWSINNSIANIPASNFVGNGISFSNNIGTSTQFPVSKGNQQNKTWESIFTLTGSTDAQYTLKAGSPAIGTGIGGINCGIFGGTTPYKLSGIPSVPTIYAISSPQGNTPTVNTVQINLSTRSNN